MLWIISVSSTVLPTPAPPNKPALPPRSSGTSTSMALMPVSKTPDLVERSDNGGGVRWTVRHCTSVGAGWRSMAWPNTSNIREIIVLPTGACRGAPVSSTSIPRANPCVGVKAMPRTLDASSCVITSTTIFRSAPARSTEKIRGKQRSKRTSTTLPRTATTALCLVEVALFPICSPHLPQFRRITPPVLYDSLSVVDISNVLLCKDVVVFVVPLLCLERPFRCFVGIPFQAFVHLLFQGLSITRHRGL